MRADHIGLKCSSKALYEFQRGLFELESAFIYQSIISNRRIAIIGLTVGIKTIAGDVRYLELSDQKPNGTQKDCIDHMEVVPISLSYEQVVEQLKNKNVNLQEVVRPHHTTYDIILDSGFVVKLSRGMLLDKVKSEEMV